MSRKACHAPSRLRLSLMLHAPLHASLAATFAAAGLWSKLVAHAFAPRRMHSVSSSGEFLSAAISMHLYRYSGSTASEKIGTQHAMLPADLRSTCASSYSCGVIRPDFLNKIFSAETTEQGAALPTPRRRTAGLQKSGCLSPKARESSLPTPLATAAPQRLASQ